MNKVILIGRLANDPESRTTQSGITTTSFRLAVGRLPGKDGTRETDFLPVVLWRQQAEFAAQYLAKGDRVGIEGSIQTRSYDAQDGSKRYVTEIMGERLESLRDGKERATEAPEAMPAPKAPQKGQQISMREVPYDDDELPF